MPKIETRKSLLELFYQYGLFVIFVLLVLVFSILTPKFYSPQNIVNVLQQSTSLGIAVVGMVFIILTAGIDLSAGTNLFFSAMLTALLIQKGAGIFVALIFPIFFGAAFGSINGFVISKWNVMPFIATLASMSFGRGIALTIMDQKAKYFSGDVSTKVMGTRILGIPVIVYGLIIILVVSQIILKYTRFGRHLYAIGHNENAAEKIGINVKRKKFLVYVIGGALAGLSGFVAAAQVGTVTPSFGKGLEFIIITSAVLGGVSLFGGKGNVLPGAFIGVLIFTVLENGLVLINANPYAFLIVRGLVIFLAVAVDSIRNKGELR
jgi:ribose transport system permease protein